MWKVIFASVNNNKLKKKNKPLYLISNFQQIMNNCEYIEIIVSEDFEIENGMLGLDRDCYLSIVKFLNSSILRKV
jgi:hypothetical protein